MHGVASAVGELPGDKPLWQAAATPVQPESGSLLHARALLQQLYAFFLWQAAATPVQPESGSLLHARALLQQLYAFFQGLLSAFTARAGTMDATSRQGSCSDSVCPPVPPARAHTPMPCAPLLHRECVLRHCHLRTTPPPPARRLFGPGSRPCAS